jgi:hypothetical protein
MLQDDVVKAISSIWKNSTLKVSVESFIKGEQGAEYHKNYRRCDDPTEDSTLLTEASRIVYEIFT